MVVMPYEVGGELVNNWIINRG